MIDPTVAKLVTARLGNGPATGPTLVRYVEEFAESAAALPIRGTIYEMLRDGQIERFTGGVHDEGKEPLYRLPEGTQFEGTDETQPKRGSVRTAAQIAWDRARLANAKRGQARSD